MKFMQNKTINKILLFMVVVGSVVFVGSIVSMNEVPTVKKITQEEQQQQQQIINEKVRQLKPGEFFVYQEGTTDGMVVPWDVLKKSKTMVTMVQDLSAQNGQLAIPIYNLSLHEIELVFDTLRHDKIRIADTVLLKELVAAANAFNFFDVASDFLNVVMEKIKQRISDRGMKVLNDTSFALLNPDIKKSILLGVTSDLLRSSIIKKYGHKKDRKVVLNVEMPLINAVAMSPDGKYVVLGGDGNQDNLILVDISNSSNPVRMVLEGHGGGITSVAFSHDGKKIISGSLGKQDNLIVWDVSNLKNITHTVLKGHTHDVRAVAINAQGNLIVSGGNSSDKDNPNNLILWDISILQNATPTILKGHQGTVTSVAFAADEMIVSGASGGGDILILWDIKNIHTIKHMVLDKNFGVINAVAFSPDGDTIISVPKGGRDKVTWWNIGDMRRITSKPFSKNIGGALCIAFSPDGKSVALGSQGLMLWDISDVHHALRERLDGDEFMVKSVAFSLNGNKMASVRYGEDNSLVIWVLANDDEEALLKELKGYSLDELLLFYEVCLRASGVNKLGFFGSKEIKMFMALSQNMQRFIKTIFEK